MVEEARRLRREGVLERDGCGAGFGTPFSRSLAGVGGRLEGTSELREGWGDIEESVGRALMLGSFWAGEEYCSDLGLEFRGMER